jgi:hypothetical protein
MEKVGVILAALGMIAIGAFLFAWPAQWLWNNALVGAVDGVHPIGFWQALGLNFLFGILVKGNSNSK